MSSEKVKRIKWLKAMVTSDLHKRDDFFDFHHRFKEYENLLGEEYYKSEFKKHYSNKYHIVIVGSITNRNIEDLKIELKKIIGFEPNIKLIRFEETKTVNYHSYFTNAKDFIIEKRSHQTKGSALLDELKNRIRNEDPKFEDFLDYQKGQARNLSQSNLMKYIVEQSAYYRDYHLELENIELNDQ
jgi:hypothetical protein